MQNINHFGTFYVVATPIGHLEDITYRAVNILRTVDLILAEDTRHSQGLLNHYGISKKLLSLHDHNERERVEQLTKILQEGLSVAMISDAGTPLISDPGYHVVRALREQGIKVVPVPGPSAAIAALSVAGLPTDRFVFEGFLSSKKEAREKEIMNLQQECRTLIFYEAPHRLLALLSSLQAILGVTREAVIARELTKQFETVRSGTLKALNEWVQQDANQQRGEIVVMVKGAEASNDPKSINSERLLAELLQHLSLKEAVEIAVKVTGEKRNALYERALALKNIS